jgi:hypothetical protein
MIDALLFVLVLSAMALAIGVELAALIGWLRAGPAKRRRHQLNFEVPRAARGPCKDLVCRRVPIFLRRSVVPARKLVVSSGGRSEPSGIAGPWENWKESVSDE